MTPKLLPRDGKGNWRFLWAAVPTPWPLWSPSSSGPAYDIEFVDSDDEPYATIAALKPDIVVVSLDHGQRGGVPAVDDAASRPGDGADSSPVLSPGERLSRRGAKRAWTTARCVCPPCTRRARSATDPRAHSHFPRSRRMPSTNPLMADATRSGTSTNSTPERYVTRSRSTSLMWECATRPFTITERPPSRKRNSRIALSCSAMRFRFCMPSRPIPYARRLEHQDFGLKRTRQIDARVWRRLRMMRPADDDPQTPGDYCSSPGVCMRDWWTLRCSR